MPERTVVPIAIPEGAARVAAPTGVAPLRLTLASAVVTNYLGGITALRRLPAVLSTNDAAELRAFMLAPAPTALGLSPLEYAALKNNAAELLLHQPNLPPEWIADFAVMFSNPATEPVWRDYCLQFLAVGHGALAGRDDPAAVATRAAAVEQLRTAAADSGAATAGTALLGLATIHRDSPAAVERAELAALAESLALDAQTPEPCRITALRIAGQSGATNVLPIARDFCRNGGEMLRLAAIATIGDLGDAADLVLLDVLGRDSDPVIASTVARASDVIRKRTANLRTDGAHEGRLPRE